LFDSNKLVLEAPMTNSSLSQPEYRVMRSLMGRFHNSWDRELMTAERMFGLQQKGMVVRDSGQWKLTARGVMYASVAL
jgi:hypothetical protein